MSCLGIHAAQTQTPMDIKNKQNISNIFVKQSQITLIMCRRKQFGATLSIWPFIEKYINIYILYVDDAKSPKKSSATKKQTLVKQTSTEVSKEVDTI